LQFQLRLRKKDTSGLKGELVDRFYDVMMQEITAERENPQQK
jgi:hypothetical protein